MIPGAAAVGQLIVFAIPQALTSLTLARAEIRLKILKGNMEKLKTTWGPDVATTKPLDKIARGGLGEKIAAGGTPPVLQAAGPGNA